MSSSATLTTLRDRVEQLLHDTGNTKWATADLDEAIRQAIQRYTRVSPAEAIAAITLEAAGREVDISSLTGYQRVRRVWWDYDSAAPDYPPRWREFELWPADVLFIKAQAEPQAGDVVRVWYTHAHTLSGLDSAAATTFPAEADPLLVVGAAATAAYNRAVATSETLNVDGGVPERLLAWAAAHEARFQAELARVAAEAAACAAGSAPVAALDRWDAGW